MLSYREVYHGYLNGRYGIIRKKPYIYSHHKKRELHSVRLATLTPNRYALNTCHTYEMMVNKRLRDLRNQWEVAQKCPFLVKREWDEDKEIDRAMAIALDDLKMLKSRIANPVATFETMQEPDIPW